MQLTLWTILSTLMALAALFIVAPQAVRQKCLPVSMPTLAGAVLVPALSTTMYLLLGAPSAVTAEQPPASDHSISRASARTPAPARRSAPVSELTDGLAERLAREPGDAGGWLLLARSYHFLDRDGDARAAYAKACALGKVDPSLAAALLVDDGNQPEVEPNAASIRGTVTVSTSAAELLRPGDIVFVFAKASDGSGMPVAALRRPAKDMPFDFTLTDATAVMPGARLSDLDQASVSAHVSRNGRATDPLKGMDAGSQVVPTYSGDRIELVIGLPAPDRGGS